MAINPTGQGLKQFLAEDDGAPVCMLNLLRFAPGGRAKYAEYLEHTRQHGAKYGIEVVFVGEGRTALVADDGQAWDAVLIARYPSRAAFAAMVADPEYQAGTHLRTEALTEAVLQPTTPWAD